ncbi:MAG TPA: hypothetical protein DEF47_19525 [Herpetosiphon sp.]|uniref:STAS/SEC14 domain-containing protein n=1 Tax=Herpetosiphon aurantiacus (strain ATCC 23779 / DSM 785 / 114-95) TaxID=316274 RepID=A9B2T6_HERA2|nr:hypothetical protein [Herpetosiphon sp.]ABX05537.1 hypothetical protein Haur_2899 [Herpetosiphon aurantiacus DSM 785]HBW52083.1 hypothetical protein [Herpetosiphon sp.]
MNYKVGWLFDQQILALTHFTPAITPEEFQAIVTQTQAYLQSVRQPFHVLIDNRQIGDSNVVDLDMVMQAFPALNHAQLRWIVMILPEPIKHTAAQRVIQRQAEIQLIYVETLEQALAHLQQVDPTLDLNQQDQAFFRQP